MRHKTAYFLFWTGALLCSFLSMASPSRAGSDTPPLIALGDELYKGRADLEKCREAIQCYELAFSESAQEEIAVRLGKAYYWLGTHVLEDARLEAFQKGIDWSKKAIIENPKSIGGHYWLGVNYGKYGEAKGVFKGLSLVSPIKEALQWVLDRSPGYESGGAYRVLGRLYFKLPRLAGGGLDKALTYLRRAVEYGPRRSLNHLFLGEAYLAQKNYRLARQELNFVLNAAPEPGMEPEALEDKAEARRLLEELQKRIKE